MTNGRDPGQTRGNGHHSGTATPRTAQSESARSGGEVLPVLKLRGRSDGDMSARVKDVMTRGRDIVAETWHVEGVVAVRDRLTYPEGK
jgi:hypothetical protein